MARAEMLALALVLLACEPAVQLGARCTRNQECTAPLVCGFGRCRAECVEHRDCPIGALCLLDPGAQGSCSLADDGSCSAAAPCVGGLSCIDGACVNACTTVAECPSDAICEPTGDGRARCVRVDGARDAGVSDGGAPCAGPGCDAVVQVVAGGTAACARTRAGAIWCWGADEIAGDALPAPASCAFEPCAAAPVRISSVDELGVQQPLAGVTELCVGERHACVILGDARVACWGWGEPRGSVLGQGEFAPSSSPALLVRSGAGGRLAGVTALVCGAEQTLAREADGTWLAWGNGQFGQLGTGDISSADVAVDAPVAASAAVLSAGRDHVCALAGSGVECWGDHARGALGGGIDPGVTELSTTAVASFVDAGVVELDTGWGWSCALSGAEIFCWGARDSLGVAATTPNDCGTQTEYCAIHPVQVFRPPGVAWAHVGGGCGAHDVCAWTAAGDVWCWGENSVGVVGGSGGSAVDEPVRRTGLPAVDAVSVGDAFACALVAGDVWCWGENDAGQLGRGDPTLASDPMPARVTWPSGS